MRSIKQSDFAGLVKYITSSQGRAERLGAIEATNCDASTIGAVVAEVLATQKQNTRAEGDKTYHLLVSFAPGETPSSEVLKDIEKRICAALGFSEHQRVSSVHHDTDNMHIHIAINKIHPTRLTMYEPFRAYRTIGEICSKLEQEHGLKPVDHKSKRSVSESRASDMEQHAGVESLVSWIRRECLDEFLGASSWSDLHRLMSENGLLLRQRANGLVVESLEGTITKASTLARQFSMKSLEARLGPFEASKHAIAKLRRRYGKQPVRMRVDTVELYAEYKASMQTSATKREYGWELISDRKNRLITAAKRSNRLRRAAIKLVGGSRTAKKILYAQAYKAFSAKMRSIRAQYQQEKKSLYAYSKRLTWADWLKAQAMSGNVEALAALRAREGRLGLRGDTFMAVRPTEAPLTAPANASLDNITKKGTVIYSAGSFAIRDDGEKLQVSRNTSIESLSIALRFAVERYGNRLLVNGGDDFKNKVVVAAVDSGLNITFADPAMELRRRKLQKLKEERVGRVKEDRGGINRRGYGSVGSGAAAHSDASGPAARGDLAATGARSFKPDFGGIGRVPPPERQNRLRTLSMLPVVRFARRGQVLLPNDVPRRLEQHGTQPDNAMRWSNAYASLTPAQLAAASKYISEREAKRSRGISDIPKHSLYTESGEYRYAGQRNVDDCDLILLESSGEIFVLPTDASTAARLKRKRPGSPLAAGPNGSIKSKSKGRNK